MSTLRQMQAAQVRTDDEASGMAARLITRLFFRNASVIENQQVAPAMHLITLQGPELRGLHWAPGDKLQIRLGTSLQTRTYTPLSWDAAVGQTQILAHALAAGSGSEWVHRARAGQSVSLFGPRRSLDLGRLDPRTSVVVGDETALGLVAAWRPSHALIETGHRPSTQGLMESMGRVGTAMASQADDLHFEALASAALGLAPHDAGFVLVGRARTVQYLVRILRQEGVNSNRILTKAYWADGKAGFD